MRTLAVLGSLLALACQRSSARTSSAEDASKATIDSVRVVWDGLNDAWDRGDTAAMRPALAEELVMRTASGRVLDKEALLKYVGQQGPDTGSTAGKSFIRHKVVRVLGANGDVVECTAEAVDVIAASGATDTVITRVIDQFGRRASRWQLLNSRESFVRPPRALSPSEKASPPH
jgi:hypothetical protein